MSNFNLRNKIKIIKNKNENQSDIDELSSIIESEMYSIIPNNKTNSKNIKKNKTQNVSDSNTYGLRYKIQSKKYNHNKDNEKYQNKSKDSENQSEIIEIDKNNNEKQIEIIQTNKNKNRSRSKSKSRSKNKSKSKNKSESKNKSKSESKSKNYDESIEEKINRIIEEKFNKEKIERGRKKNNVYYNENGDKKKLTISITKLSNIKELNKKYGKIIHPLFKSDDINDFQIINFTDKDGNIIHDPNSDKIKPINEQLNSSSSDENKYIKPPIISGYILLKTNQYRFIKDGTYIKILKKGNEKTYGGIFKGFIKYKNLSHIYLQVYNSKKYLKFIFNNISAIYIKDLSILNNKIIPLKLIG